MSKKRGVVRPRTIVKGGEKVQVFVYTYYDLNGKRHEPYAYTKRDAELELAKIEKDILLLRLNAPSSRTLNHALDGYLAELDVKQTTKLRYSRIANTHIRRAIGRIKLDKLDTKTIQRLVIDPMLTGYAKDTRGHVRSVLKGALDWAADQEWINTNPLIVKRLKLGKGDTEPMIRPTEQDIKAILWYVSQPAPPHRRAFAWEYTRAIAVLAYYAAMGRAEQCGLRWKNIDFVTGTINLTNNYTDEDRLTSMKTPWRRRTIDMIPEIRAVLEPIALRQNGEGVWDIEGPVFRNTLGNKVWATISPRDMSDLWFKAMEKLELTRIDDKGRKVVKFGIHGMRAASLNAHLRGANDLMATVEFAGHKNANMLIRHYGYNQDGGAAKQRAVAKMRSIAALPAPTPNPSCDTDATED